MAQPTTRNEFKEYCLRKLGKGQISIELTDDQAEDRIDDALQIWNEQHMDGAVEVYLKHQITQADKDNGYITIPATVSYVSAILPVHDKDSAISMFDIRYQLHLHDIFDLNFAGSLSNYVQTQQYIGLLDQVLNAQEGLSYSKHGRKIYITTDWDRLDVGEHLIFKVWSKVDPEVDAAAWQDRWLKAYATALMRMNWGDNLSKYDGVLMLGGVTVSGQQILDRGLAEQDDLLEELKNSYTAPVDFLVG